MAGNTTVSKKFQSMNPALSGGRAEAPKTAKAGNEPGRSVGQLRGRGDRETYANPMNDGINPGVKGLDGLYDDIGEKSGFISDGYIDKQGTPYGEAAKFNFMPPGMDISNQENAEIHAMPLRKLVAESYPGDGWMPTPRDIPE